MTIETVAQTQPAEAEAQKSSAEQNLTQMRKLLEKERAEKEEFKLKAKKLEEERKQFNSPYNQNDDDDDSDEPYIDKKTLRKNLLKERESIKKELKEEVREEMRNTLEEEKKQSYLKTNSDFEQIMSPEIVQKFADKYPGMAEAILRMPDGFDRQRLVYEAIKNTGAHKKEESPSIQGKIDANRRTPFYQPSGVGTAPYASQGDFSDTGQKTAYTKMKELQSRLRLG